MKKSFCLLCCALFSAVVFEASAVDGNSQDSLRYDKSMAARAINPVSLFSLKFGRGENEVSGDKEDEKRISYGVPYAFLPLKDGSVWVLDTIARRLKHFNPTGAFLEEINLEAISSGNAPIRDFAPGPENGFYFFSTEDSKVYRTDSSGKIICEIEGLDDTWSLMSDREGNVWVDNPRMRSVFCFNPSGELVEKFHDIEGLTNIRSSDGKLFGIKGDDYSAVIYRTQAEPQKGAKIIGTDRPAAPVIEMATIRLEDASAKKIGYVDKRILGLDDRGNMYFSLVACDENGTIYQNRIYRIPENGGQFKFWEIISAPCFSPDLPRHLSVMPDGRIMGFSVQGETYNLIAYNLP